MYGEGFIRMRYQIMCDRKGQLRQLLKSRVTLSRERPRRNSARHSWLLNPSSFIRNGGNRSDSTCKP